MKLDDFLGKDLFVASRELFKKGSWSLCFNSDVNECTYRILASYGSGKISVTVHDITWGTWGGPAADWGSYGEEFEDEYDIYYPFCYSIVNCFKHLMNIEFDVKEL